MIDNSYRDQSEFNTAMGYVTRLNSLFTLCAEQTLNNNLLEWFRTLILIYKELSTEMTKKELETYSDKIREMNNKIQVVLKNNIRKGEKTIPFDLYTELTDMEIQLRKLTKSAGLLNKMKDDPGHALRA